jgi:hypothetical protein
MMKLTLSIIAICVFVFVLQSVGIVGDNLSFTPAKFSVEPYTILTSMFMHNSIEHILLNMIGLFTFGVILENAVGAKRWLIIYFTSGFIASLGYVLLSSSPFIPAVGASGAIFGLMGSVAALKPKQVIYTMYGPVPMLGAAIIWGITEFASMFSMDNIAHSAHLFGMFGGVIFALMCIKNIDWKIMLPMIVIPVAALFLVTSGMPAEIPGYQPLLPDCFNMTDKLEETQDKVYLYACNNESVLTSTYPYEGGFSLADYSRSLPSSAERIYEANYNRPCISNTTHVDESNGTAIIVGDMCEYKFYSMAKICNNNIEVDVIELYKSLPALTSIDCAQLKT